MFQIDKQSELYKFVNCHCFDQRSHTPGGWGYNFCNYGRQLALACLVGVGCYSTIAWLAIFGIVPWLLSWFFGYPNPVEYSGSILMAVASLVTAVMAVMGVIGGMVVAVCVSADQTNWHYKANAYIKRTVGKWSIVEFVKTGYDAWKEKYCPLIEVIDSKENSNVD